MSYNKALLGSYIEQIDRRNSRLEYGVEDVMGITNTKVLMETKARPEYADLSKFYILEPQEFIYNPRTSRNGEKVGMAYNDTDHNILFTFNNIPFRIKTECRDILDSNYLYLYFLNPEFDRYARYNSWGSATELFPWEEMCRITIPVPPISEQRKIVHDYQVITDRIELLQKMNENLVSQCDALYRKLVLEQSLNGKFSDIADVSSGKRPENMNKGGIPLLGAGGVMDYIEDYNYNEPSLIIGRVGTHGVVQRCKKFWASDNTLVIIPKYYEYVFHILRNIDYAALNRGSTQPLITQGDINALDVYIPEDEIIDDFENKCSVIMSCYSKYQDEINNLSRIRSLLITQMSKEG